MSTPAEETCSDWITIFGAGGSPQLTCGRPKGHEDHHANQGGYCWEGSGPTAKRLNIKRGWSLCFECFFPFKPPAAAVGCMYDHACPSCRSKLEAEEDKRRAIVEQARKRNEDARKGSLSKYGITHQDYLAMYRDQGGACAVCKKKRPPIRFSRPVTNVLGDDAMPLVTDHCHETGVVRGLLCVACNTAEGLLGSDPEIIENLLVYVQHFKAGGKNSTLEGRGVQ